MLGSDDREIRRTAIRSLSSFDGIDELVLPFLNDPDWATRAAAIEVLGRKATDKARAEVEKLFDSEEDPAVKSAIEEFFHVR
jgi:HEAT repeat protein